MEFVIKFNKKYVAKTFCDRKNCVVKRWATNYLLLILKWSQIVIKFATYFGLQICNSNICYKFGTKIGQNF